MKKYPYLSYDKSMDVEERIQKENYLGFGSKETSRLDLFLYAMSLGKGTPTKLKKKEQYVRSEYVDSRPEALPLLAALAIGETGKFNLFDDFVLDENYFLYAEECANTGFKVLEDIMKNSAGNMEKRLLSSLDDLYAKIKKVSDKE